MELKKEDFDKLQYNVYKLDINEDILKKFPDLTRFNEFTTVISKQEFVDGNWIDTASNIDKNKVLRYVFYCYDKYSPFMMEKNLTRRKVLCAQEAGFVVDKEGKFNDEVDGLLRGDNDFINRMIVRFVRNQRDLRFALLVAGMENYYDNIAKLAEVRKKDGAKAGNEKTDLFNSTKDMLDELEKLSDEIFNNDKDLMFVADQVNEEEEEKILSWPEHWAKLTSKNGN